MTHKNARIHLRSSGSSVREDLSPFDDHLRYISTVLFAAGMLVVLLVDNTGFVHLESMHRTALNMLVLAAGLSVVGILLFPWRRYDRNLFLVATLDGLCLIALANYFSGGWESPFYPLYFFVVVFCAIYYSPWIAASMVFFTMLVSMSPQLYAPDASRLAEHVLVRVPIYLALAFVSWYMAREVSRRERLRAEYERGFGQMRELKERFQQEASTDLLTGLPNRVLFVDRLEQALARAEQRGGEVAVLFVDLDDFKVINDSLGHQEGDRLLVSVAQRLRAFVKSQDIVARFGGDEFVILLEDSNTEEASRVAQRLTEGMRTYFALDERELIITCSIGIVLSGSAASAERPADLLRRSDMALYEAKAKGKNRYAVFEEAMEVRAMERLETEHNLRRVLDRKEGLVVHYQPVVSLNEGGRIIGFEALVRWNDPSRGLLLPREFISLAEQTGLIVQVEHWVLQEACRQVQEWRRHYPSDPALTVSVNLSARQLARRGLIEDITQVLSSCGVEPCSLILEITESSLIGDVDASIALLRRFKQLGVRIAVDDFGKEYSSLSYLKRLPVDMLKIDRSFVGGLGTDDKDEGIFRAVIDLARTLGLEVVAEGVESGEQLKHLREVGCNLAQGFYFWHPLPAEKAIELLATYNYQD
jgi:diguanylate cyclase (GGDEF)-like protein